MTLYSAEFPDKCMDVYERPSMNLCIFIFNFVTILVGAKVRKFTKIKKKMHKLFSTNNFDILLVL